MRELKLKLASKISSLCVPVMIVAAASELIAALKFVANASNDSVAASLAAFFSKSSFLVFIPPSTAIALSFSTICSSIEVF